MSNFETGSADQILASLKITAGRDGVVVVSAEAWSLLDAVVRLLVEKRDKAQCRVTVSSIAEAFELGRMMDAAGDLSGSEDIRRAISGVLTSLPMWSESAQGDIVANDVVRSCFTRMREELAGVLTVH